MTPKFGWRRRYNLSPAPLPKRLPGAQKTRNTPKGKSPRPDDGIIDRDALLWILCPRASDDGLAYNRFVGWLGTLKSLGFMPQEVADWCNTGTAGSCGDVAEIESRWAGLPEDDPEDARTKLRGSAFNSGWRHPELHGRCGNAGNPAGPSPGVGNEGEVRGCLGPIRSGWLQQLYRRCQRGGLLAGPCLVSGGSAAGHR